MESATLAPRASSRGVVFSHGFRDAALAHSRHGETVETSGHRNSVGIGNLPGAFPKVHGQPVRPPAPTTAALHAAGHARRPGNAQTHGTAFCPCHLFKANGLIRMQDEQVSGRHKHFVVRHCHRDSADLLVVKAGATGIAPDTFGIGRVADVDHVQLNTHNVAVMTKATAARNHGQKVGIIARDRHGPGCATGGVAPHSPWIGRLADVNHLQAAFDPVRSKPTRL